MLFCSRMKMGLSSIPDTQKLAELVRLAHRQYVKILISVGGWGWEKQFERLAASPARRTTFIQGLLKVLNQYHFDGVDMDWEYPNPGASAQNFLRLMQELRIALPKSSLLTAAVVALGEHAAGIPTESFAMMDFANIMAYDDDTSPQHSSLDYRKIRPGFLARARPARRKPSWGCHSMPARARFPMGRSSEADPKAAQLDSTFQEGDQIYYNGIPTIQAKTRLAMQRASGIMFWKLENDASGEVSLLGRFMRCWWVGKSKSKSGDESRIPGMGNRRTETDRMRLRDWFVCDRFQHSLIRFHLRAIGVGWMRQTTNPIHPSYLKIPNPQTSRFPVIAYVTDAAVPAVIPYDKLTDINYAFLIPNEDGTFAAA